jgi:RHH-type transcriptional regulator, rel operon repressor / antitoxin RelB
MKKNISISLDEEIIKKIDDMCRVSERTKSWLVNKAVKNYLEEIEDVEIAFQRSMDPDSEFITEKQIREDLDK